MLAIVAISKKAACGVFVIFGVSESISLSCSNKKVTKTIERDEGEVTAIFESPITITAVLGRTRLYSQLFPPSYYKFDSCLAVFSNVC